MHRKKHLAELGLHPYIGDCLTSYYSSVTRIWQFLAGGLVIFLPNVNSGPVQKNIYSASLLLIFFSVCVPFSFIPQSILSLVVIASTILLIKYAKGCQILENRFILFLGKISFSLYLVHMPLIVFYKGYTMQSPSEGVLAILVAVAILAAYAFYNYVEKAQFKKHHAILLYGLALTISLTLLYTNGLKNQWHSETNNITFNKYDHFRYRYDNSLLKEYNASTMVTYGSTGAAIVNTLSSEKCSISKAHPSPFLQIGKDSLMPSFVLIGDSHAIMSYPGLDEICAKKGVSGILMNSLFLPFVDREYGNPLDSYAINENKTKDFLKWLNNQENIEHIVIIFSWYWTTNDLCVSSQGKKIQDLVFENMESMKSYLHELNSINKKAIVFMPYPRFATNNMPMYVRHRHRRGLTETPILGEYIVTKEEYRSMWGECITKLKELEKIGLCSIIDPTTELFKNGSCYSIDNNKLNFFDCNHMSADVSLDVAQSIEHQFFNLLERE